jgi:hypothetical protein
MYIQNLSPSGPSVRSYIRTPYVKTHRTISTSHHLSSARAGRPRRTFPPAWATLLLRFFGGAGYD